MSMNTLCSSCGGSKYRNSILCRTCHKTKNFTASICPICNGVKDRKAKRCQFCTPIICPQCKGPKDRRAKRCRKCEDPILTERVCTKCKQLKSVVSDFRIRTRATPRPRPVCKLCESQMQKDRNKRDSPERILFKAKRKRQWEIDNPLKHARQQWRRSIRILGLKKWMNDILVLLETQKTCTICKNLPDSKQRLHIDHDHTTGQFRGLICSTCNLVLGKFKDDPIRFRCAAIYLEKELDKVDVPMIA
jgi:Recombination endonuclease VII